MRPGAPGRLQIPYATLLLHLAESALKEFILGPRAALAVPVFHGLSARYRLLWPEKGLLEEDQALGHWAPGMPRLGICGFLTPLSTLAPHDFTGTP